MTLPKNKIFQLASNYSLIMGDDIVKNITSQTTSVVLDKVVFSKGEPVSSFTTRDIPGGSIKGTLNAINNIGTKVFSKAQIDGIQSVMPSVSASRFSWVTMGDDKVRFTHQGADGQIKYSKSTVGYLIGGYDCENPRDDNLPDEEKYGCRCWQDMEVVDREEVINQINLSLGKLIG